jgi:hypothetical protein
MTIRHGILTLVFSLSLAIGCKDSEPEVVDEEETTGEEVEEEVDEAAEDTSEAVDEAGDDVEEAVE